MKVNRNVIHIDLAGNWIGSCKFIAKSKRLGKMAAINLQCFTKNGKSSHGSVSTKNCSYLNRGVSDRNLIYVDRARVFNYHSFRRSQTRARSGSWSCYSCHVSWLNQLPQFSLLFVFLFPSFSSSKRSPFRASSFCEWIASSVRACAYLAGL